jgi:hypothetical protein
VIAAGGKVPSAGVWFESREQTTTAQLAESGPFLLVFYLYDWSSV